MSSSCSSSRVSSKSVFHFIHKRFLASSSSNVVGLIHTEKLATTKTLELNPNTSIEKHASVINFFKSLGFPDAHISKIVAKRPHLLKADVEKTLKPKVDCLVDYGFAGSFVRELIVANPNILTRSPESHLLPILRLVQTYIGSNDKVAAAVKRYSLLLSYGNKETVEQNLNLLVSEGVPIKTISKLISCQPRSITQKVDRMVYVFNSAKQFGFSPVDPMLVYAIDCIIGMSESTFTKKIEFVKSLLGCSEEEVKSAFKRYPFFLAKSEDKLKNVVNFFVNTVKVEEPTSVLLAIPQYFSYSVDKRMVPRHNVYQILESKNLLQEGMKFPPWLVRKSEKWFVSNYVVKYLDQVPDLMELYHGFMRTGNTQ